MSQEVLNAQQWLNTTYGNNPDYISVEETGYPGTATSAALVSAMQIELGVAPVTGIFGDLTSVACDSNPLSIGSTGNRVTILQHGFYCKGYNPTGVTGNFQTGTQGALVDIQEDAGLEGNQVSTIAYGLQVGAVLGIDEYKKVSRGDTRIRDMQQFINHTYLDYTGLSPCDGVYSRGTNKALILALQAEENMPTSIANGNFGTNTKNCVPTIPYNNSETDYNNSAYDSQSISNFIKISQFALYCIGHDQYSSTPFDGSKYDPGSFNGVFNNDTKYALHDFQKDVALEERDEIGLDEWMGLLVSTGNPDRVGTACDCATRLTSTTASQLYNAGYRIVGRYLTGDIVVNNTRIAKNLLRPEMKAIFAASLKLFVIFQDARQYYHDNPEEDDIFNYYNYDRGYADAEKAFSAAKTLGVPRNEIIYFTVDYDFMAAQVVSRIIPYFEGVNAYAEEADYIYQIGIYGSRNTCTLVKNESLSVSSFVSDLSTGYSGNMGFALPDDWAFDQIKEYSPGGSIGVGIDKNVSSGRYEGFNHFESSVDNEWDFISSNGYAYILYGNEGNTYPVGTGLLPIYWSKVKNSDGTFEAKYPMYDDIPVGAFYSRRRININRDDATGDKIRYVYFRDVGGSLNAGYIDESLIESYGEINSGKFQSAYFGEVVVWLNSSGEVDVNGMYYTVAPSDTQKIHMLLTKPTQAYTASGTLHSTLSTGTTVEILMVTTTGASYPYLIQCTAKKLPNSSDWEYLIPGASYGFINLDFEHGVMPETRNMITGYN